MITAPRKSDWRLTALLPVIGLIGLIPLAVGFFVKQPGSLVVVMRDPVFQTEVASGNCRIRLDGRTIHASARAGPRGTAFDLGTVEAVQHNVQWEIEGFRPGDRNVTVNPKRVEPATTLAVDLEPVFGCLEIEGIDALTNQKLAGPAEISTDEIKTGSMTNGAARISGLGPGIHKVAVDAEGYCREERSVNVIPGKIAKESIALSPAIRQDEAARIILDWKNPPDDIDAHLFISLSGERDKRHVYFRALESNKDERHVATLDVDKRTPGGFETVTIWKGFSGSFLYVVSNYSRREAIAKKLPLPPHITSADPTVRLYVSGDCRPRQYKLAGNSEDLEWAVLELIVDDQGLISTKTPDLRSGAAVGKAAPGKQGLP